MIVFEKYLKSVGAYLAAGNATEHTYRAALSELLESIETAVKATNEPKRTKVGAPDYIVKHGNLTIGYVEAKDVGDNLKKTAGSEQLKRYRAAFPNLILTDYLEFHHFVDGELHATARLADEDSSGKLKQSKEGAKELQSLLGSFFAAEPQSAGTPKELAEQLAARAREIRTLISGTFREEGVKGQLHSQLQAFRKTLIPELKAEDFADMYAQTIAYGLFAARTTSEGQDFNRWSASQFLPKTNPFLRNLFYEISGPNLDERIAWMVDDLAEYLNRADMAAILKDFGRRTRQEDPVVHFYETFLAAYDRKMREARGVYYTPEPVVSYIVRSVDHLLKEKFDRPAGLADENTLVLDPATGTATFLYYVIRHIHEHLEAQGQLGGWSPYVRENLLPRIFGFELLMAPYTVAHMKLGVLLQELGYDFSGDERLNVYLTNTLEEGSYAEPTGFAEYIADEANAAAKVKNEEPIEVIIGNPPYSENSANKGDWISGLLNQYKKIDGNTLGERNPKALLNDYVKFIRFGQWRIEKSGQGILAFITSHTYLDSVILRGMRKSLIDSFSDIYILDLHGNMYKEEVSPDGGKDQNVFDIRQGVSIAIFVKSPGHSGKAKVHQADFWGLRADKYQSLYDSNVDSTEWRELEPESPHYFLSAQTKDLLDEYENGWNITSVMPVFSNGVKTHRDHFALDFKPENLRKKIEDFRNESLSDDEIASRYKLKDTRDWKLSERRKHLASNPDWESHLTKNLYRPFDKRAYFHHNSVVDRPRNEVMRHMVSGTNLALLTNRQVKLSTVQHFLATEVPTDFHILETANAAVSVYPLYLYSSEENKTSTREELIHQTEREMVKRAKSGLIPAQDLENKLDNMRAFIEAHFPEEADRWPNLSPEFVMELSEKLGLSFVADGVGDLTSTFGPEDVFNYAYAVFHSPTYRERYAEFLKRDFPRLPLTSDAALFAALAGLGRELVGLHLMTSPKLGKLITRFPEEGDGAVERVRYDVANERVYINKTQYFEGVPEEVWEFRVGGYQVLDKWLKDRKGRTLSFADTKHYQQVVVTLSETKRIMQEIDETIPGWPLG